MLAPNYTPPRKSRASPPLSDSRVRDHNSPGGLGVGTDACAPSIRTEHDYDIHAGLTTNWSTPEPDDRMPPPSNSGLSPGQMSNSAGAGLSPRVEFYSPGTPHTASRSGRFEEFNSGASSRKGPFNFNTVQYTAGSKMSEASGDALEKRRGHKYRHSSVHASHMDTIIRPLATPRTPLSVPASLPVPTQREAWRSMNRSQTVRLAWCGSHFLITAYVQYTGAGSLAMTALSRLLLFDAASTTVCEVVDVMGNFEVWNRPSIKHPFGLERADVLAGFAMAVFLAFMGLDVISHGIQHSLENIGHHESHSPHSRQRVDARAVWLAAFLAVTSTLISAVMFKSHARIGKAMRLDRFAGGWGRVLRYPSHLLTLACSALLLLLLLLPSESSELFDPALAFVMAGLMIALALKLGSSLTSMLLMSFNPLAGNKAAVRRVIDEIAQADSAVIEVEQARFWQPHYGLCMANLKLRYQSRDGGYGVGEEATRLRQKVSSLIRQRLGGSRWDISIQMTQVN